MAEPSLEPSLNLTCRFELDFVLAMETNTLGETLWEEISPGTVRPPSEGNDDNLILRYAASRLQEYQLGHSATLPVSTRFDVVVADLDDRTKETEWTLLHGPDLSEHERAECEAHIRHLKGRLQNRGSNAMEPNFHPLIPL